MSKVKELRGKLSELRAAKPVYPQPKDKAAFQALFEFDKEGRSIRGPTLEELATEMPEHASAIIDYKAASKKHADQVRALLKELDKAQDAENKTRGYEELQAVEYRAALIAFGADHPASLEQLAAVAGVDLSGGPVSSYELADLVKLLEAAWGETKAAAFAAELPSQTQYGAYLDFRKHRRAAFETVRSELKGVSGSVLVRVIDAVSKGEDHNAALAEILLARELANAEASEGVEELPELADEEAGEEEPRDFPDPVQPSQNMRGNGRR